ncbi:hypothetical protein SAMN06295888_101362 [Desulfonatronum zhilinae]|nr:hypothetical protein SAMN06295888_101362 [Desulfonatronum zhilinae]
MNIVTRFVKFELIADDPGAVGIAYIEGLMR